MAKNTSNVLQDFLNVFHLAISNIKNTWSKYHLKGFKVKMLTILYYHSNRTLKIIIY